MRYEVLDLSLDVRQFEAGRAHHMIVLDNFSKYLLPIVMLDKN